MGRNSASHGVDEMLADGNASCGIASISAHARPTFRCLKKSEKNGSNRRRQLTTPGNVGMGDVIGFGVQSTSTCSSRENL